MGLPSHQELAVEPIDIAQLQRGHFANAQPETLKDRKHAKVPPPLGAGPVTTGEQAADRLPDYAARRPGARPARHRRHSTGQ